MSLFVKVLFNPVICNNFFRFLKFDDIHNLCISHPILNKKIWDNKFNEKIKQYKNIINRNIDFFADKEIEGISYSYPFPYELATQYECTFIISNVHENYIICEKLLPYAIYCFHGDYSLIELIMSKDEYVPGYGCFYSVKFLKHELIKFFLEKDISRIDKNEFFKNIAHTCDSSLIKEFIRYYPNYCKYMEYAIKNDNLDVVIYYLNIGASDFQKYIRHAIKHDKQKILQYLISLYIEFNQETIYFQKFINGTIVQQYDNPSFPYTFYISVLTHFIKFHKNEIFINLFNSYKNILSTKLTHMCIKSIKHKNSYIFNFLIQFKKINIDDVLLYASLHCDIDKLDMLLSKNSKYMWWKFFHFSILKNKRASINYYIHNFINKGYYKPLSQPIKNNLQYICVHTGRLDLLNLLSKYDTIHHDIILMSAIRNKNIKFIEYLGNEINISKAIDYCEETQSTCPKIINYINYLHIQKQKKYIYAILPLLLTLILIQLFIFH